MNWIEVYKKGGNRLMLSPQKQMDYQVAIN